MRLTEIKRRSQSELAAGVAVALLCGAFLPSCTSAVRPNAQAALRLSETVNLIDEVKTFGRSLGIEPTEALARTAGSGPALSMLWLWMQRVGTIALQGPVDVRMAIGFYNESDRLKLEQVYRVDGYSVYYRQGNEFADARSVTTAGFAVEPIVRRVTVVLHEDLHGDANFELPWEVEEAVVTPLGALATVEFFRRQGDAPALETAVEAVAEERQISRELNELAQLADRLLKSASPDEANNAIFDLMPQFPNYERRFRRQTRGQHAATTLEAKLSHDLAYYRYFDRIAMLSETAPDLKTLVRDLKGVPTNANHALVDELLTNLAIKYSAAAM
jgi:GNAT superfamily N-acetyltransferase